MPPLSSLNRLTNLRNTIIRLPLRMTYNMFLDDERYPSDTSPLVWIIVRSFVEAVDYVTEHGCPLVISFDHDLGTADNKTGHDFAKWLCEQDMDSPGFMPADFTFVVHSMNNVGAVNIQAYLDAYLRQR